MNITKLRKLWFTISSTLVITSIFLMGMLSLNLGLDFTGGARWDLKFNDQSLYTEASPDKLSINNEQLKTFFEVREELSKEVKIQTSEDGEYLITIEDLSDEQIQAISMELETQFGSFETKSYRKVDATIGASFKKKSVWAILAALTGIILFVAYAFRKIPASVNPWRFGAVAIVALFHDVLIVLGVFTILGFMTGTELDLAFITALLATVGFSVNDTIVILDRVRENVRTQKPHETFEDTIEKSVQQTLRRSINTSISTLLPLVALLFFGAKSIFFFVLALTIGIVIGTYSSIFLAAPLLAEWKVWADGKEQ